ncbi:MAG TPA: ABC transporter permease [Verrucomicrobiae bacterium]|jgi:phospholipid/cholesterol/gamma-HCH transport system permease protein
MQKHGESTASARIESSGSEVLLKVGGTWRLAEELPRLPPLDAKFERLKVVPDKLECADSSLAVFLWRARRWCHERQAVMDVSALPKELRELFRQISESEERAADIAPRPAEPRPIRKLARAAVVRAMEPVRFVGDCAIAAVEIPARPRQFSWRDFVSEMAGAGPKALPIIGLLSFLIGLTFAYETSLQLQKFGADAFVVEALGLAVVRQCSPLIAALVLAGRTGAAFAARIANMKLGGELDALELTGVSPISYLVLPRVAALVLIMPLITLYSDLFGVLGGMVISVAKTGLSAAGFWVQLQGSVSLQDVLVGTLKGLVFGLVVALAGTLRGLQSERSSIGVGRAVTSAVVTGVAGIISADALLAPILKNLNF